MYIGPKSRTERPRKTKIGRKVAHVTRDSYTTFKVKGQGQGHQAALVGCSSQANVDMQLVTHPYVCMMYIMSQLARGRGMLWRPPTQLATLHAKLCSVLYSPLSVCVFVYVFVCLFVCLWVHLTSDSVQCLHRV